LVELKLALKVGELFSALEHFPVHNLTAMTNNKKKFNRDKRIESEVADYYAQNAEQLNQKEAKARRNVWTDETRGDGDPQDEKINAKDDKRVKDTRENRKTVFQKGLVKEGVGLNPTKGEIIRLLDIYDTFDDKSKENMTLEQFKTFYMVRYAPARRLLHQEFNKSFRPNRNKTQDENTAKLRNASFNLAMIKRHEGKKGFENENKTQSMPHLAVSEYKLRNDLNRKYIPPPVALVTKGKRCSAQDRENYTHQVRDFVKQISNKSEVSKGAPKRFSIVKQSLPSNVATQIAKQVNLHCVCNKKESCGECTRCTNEKIIIALQKENNRNKQKALSDARKLARRADKNLHLIHPEENGANGEAKGKDFVFKVPFCQKSHPTDCKQAPYHPRERPNKPKPGAEARIAAKTKKEAGGEIEVKHLLLCSMHIAGLPCTCAKSIAHIPRKRLKDYHDIISSIDGVTSLEEMVMKGVDEETILTQMAIDEQQLEDDAEDPGWIDCRAGCACQICKATSNVVLPLGGNPVVRTGESQGTDKLDTSSVVKDVIGDKSTPLDEKPPILSKKEARTKKKKEKINQVSPTKTSPTNGVEIGKPVKKEALTKESKPEPKIQNKIITKGVKVNEIKENVVDTPSRDESFSVNSIIKYEREDYAWRNNMELPMRFYDDFFDLPFQLLPATAPPEEEVLKTENVNGEINPNENQGLALPFERVSGPSNFTDKCVGVIRFPDPHIIYDFESVSQAIQEVNAIGTLLKSFTYQDDQVEFLTLGLSEVDRSIAKWKQVRHPIVKGWMAQEPPEREWNLCPNTSGRIINHWKRARARCCPKFPDCESCQSYRNSVKLGVHRYYCGDGLTSVPLYFSTLNFNDETISSAKRPVEDTEDEVPEVTPIKPLEGMTLIPHMLGSRCDSGDPTSGLVWRGLVFVANYLLYLEGPKTVPFNFNTKVLATPAMTKKKSLLYRFFESGAYVTTKAIKLASLGSVDLHVPGEAYSYTNGQTTVESRRVTGNFAVDVTTGLWNSYYEVQIWEELYRKLLSDIPIFRPGGSFETQMVFSWLASRLGENVTKLYSDHPHKEALLGPTYRELISHTILAVTHRLLVDFQLSASAVPLQSRSSVIK